MFKWRPWACEGFIAYDGRGGGGLFQVTAVPSVVFNACFLVPPDLGLKCYRNDTRDVACMVFIH